MSCTIEHGYYDLPSHYQLKSKKLTARKAHTCYECGCRIEKKQRFLIEQDVVDKRIITTITCIDCLSVREALFCTWIYGQLWQDLFENMSENFESAPSSEHLKKMTERGRNMVFETWEKVGTKV